MDKPNVRAHTNTCIYTHAALAATLNSEVEINVRRLSSANFDGENLHLLHVSYACHKYVYASRCISDWGVRDIGYVTYVWHARVWHESCVMHMCGVTHSYMQRHDSFTWMRHSSLILPDMTDSHEWDMTHLYVRDMTHLYCQTWLIYFLVRHDSFLRTKHDSFLCARHDSFLRVRHDWFLRARHDSFLRARCETWLIPPCETCLLDIARLMCSHLTPNTCFERAQGRERKRACDMTHE